MADIRKFFASEGFTGNHGKSEGGVAGGDATSRSSSSTSCKAGAVKPLSTGRTAAAPRRESKSVSAAKQATSCGKGGGLKKGGRAQKMASSSSSSSSSEASAESEAESSSSSDSEAETFSPPKTKPPRKGGRLRRVIASDSENECEAVDPSPPSSSGSSSSSSNSSSSRSIKDKSSKSSSGTRCVILEPGEADSDDGTAKKTTKKNPPAVTLEKFLKPAAAASQQQQQQVKQQQQAKQPRVEVDVDSFFAAAATKELEKHKKAAGGDAAPRAAAAAAAAANDAATRASATAAKQLPGGVEVMAVDEERTPEKHETKVGAASPQNKKRKLPFTPETKQDAATEAAPLALKKSKGGPRDPAAEPSSGSRSSKTELAGKKLVLTGVLQQMQRETAVERILAAGGTVTTAVSGRTDLLVVGSVLEDGRPVESGSKYRKATELQQKGGSIQIINEEKFLSMLGFTEASPTADGRGAAPAVAAPASAAIPVARAAAPAAFAPPVKAAEAVASKSTLWAEKYRPQTPEEFVGNSEPFRLLCEWLRDWQDVCIKGRKKDNPKPRFSSASFSTGMFPPSLNMNARACLLSGPPGIGKTTAAGVAVRLQGLQLLEFNASDTRNKAHIEELQDLVTGGVTVNFFKLDKKDTGTSASRSIGRFPCLILDEVDGLSGGDRGGSQAILKLIDETRIPIICVCNDRMSTKVRTLASRCLDLRFEKPTAIVLKTRMRQIAKAEGISVSDETLSKIAEVSDGDIRQCVGQLQLLAAQIRDPDTQKKNASFCSSKDTQVMLGPFECCKLLLDTRTGSRMKVWEKLDHFFVDYDMMPLLIQENYLTAISQGVQQRVGSSRGPSGAGRGPSAELEGLSCCARAARALVIADTAGTALRTSQDWSLLPTMGSFCCVSVPAEAHKVDGFIPRVNFPSWFGRNSTQTKNRRLFSELLLQLLKIPTSGSSIGSLKLSGYLDGIYAMAVAPLVNGDDPKETARRLEAYGLRREHLVEHIQSLMLKRQDRLYDKVDSKSKAALTRLCSAMQQQVHITKSRRAKSDSLKQVIEGEEGDFASEGLSSDSDAQSEQPKKKGGAPNRRAGKAAGTPKAAPKGATKGASKGAPKAAGSRARGGGGGGRRGGKAKA